MKRNRNGSNKQDSTSRYCQETVVVLYLKLQAETTCSKTQKHAGPETKVGSGKTVEQSRRPVRAAGRPPKGWAPRPRPRPLARLSSRPVWTPLPRQPCPHPRQPLGPVDLTSRTWGQTCPGLCSSHNPGLSLEPPQPNSPLR